MQPQKVCMTRADRYRVLLIRSGATEWDEQDYLPGVADLPMCPHERERLAVDDAMVGPAAVASVLSAGDEASTETASIVARSLGVKAKKCVDLGDVDLGLWQGLRMSELRERAPKVYKQWVDDFITQVAAAWVLSCVFVRFLEDNELIDPPRIAGAKNRLDRARDEHTLFFQDAERAKLTDREYLLDIFDRLAQSSAGSGGRAAAVLSEDRLRQRPAGA